MSMIIPAIITFGCYIAFAAGIITWNAEIVAPIMVGTLAAVLIAALMLAIAATAAALFQRRAEH